jgi:hypothetical protein
LGSTPEPKINKSINFKNKYNCKLKALLGKREQHTRTSGKCKLRDEESKKESKGNVRNENHYKRNEECLS